MSIQGEITRIGNNVSNAMEVVAAMGVDVPATASSNDLAALISAIPQPTPMNLLDNSDFRNPVNQRGLTEYASGSKRYTLDRWRATAAVTVTVNDYYVTFSNTASTGYAVVQPLTDKQTPKPGEMVTLACEDSDGKVIFGVVRMPLTGSAVAVTEDGVSLMMYAADGTEKARFAISLSGNTTKGFKWAALYRAKCNSVPNYIAKGFAAELAECQRYYQVITAPANLTLGLAYAINATRVYAHLKLQPMREAPRLVSADGVRLGKSGFSDNVDTVTVFAFSPNTGDTTLEIAVTSGTSMATGDVWRLGLAKDTTLAFDADL